MHKAGVIVDVPGGRCTYSVVYVALVSWARQAKAATRVRDGQGASLSKGTNFYVRAVGYRT